MNFLGIVSLVTLGIVLFILVFNTVNDAIWNYRLKRFHQKQGIKQNYQKTRVLFLKRGLMVTTSLVLGMVVVVSDIFYLPESIVDAFGNEKVLVSAQRTNSLNDIQAKVNESYGFQWFPSIGGGWAIDEAQSAPNTEDTEVERDVVSTNLQVKGVDEGDILKTDGYEVIYSPQFHKNIIYRFDVESDGTLTQKEAIEFESYVVETMYLTDEYIVVIGYYYQNIAAYYQFDMLILPSNFYFINYQSAIKIIDKNSLEEVYELQMNGNVKDHRIKDDMLYVVTYTLMYEEDLIPKFTEISDGEETSSTLSFNDIYYFEGIPGNQMMVVTVLDLHEKTFDSEAVLGVPSFIYMTEDAIYLAGNYYYVSPFDDGLHRTHIIQFTINHETKQMSYAASVQLEGVVHNQFHLDAYVGYLRVVTSLSWFTDGKNHLYILKENKEADTFDFIGHLNEGIGKPEERVTAVRFVENQVFIVTFRNTDPIYTIDLTDPTKPNIVNFVEEPGYNTYLHYWDDDHLVGIGYDENFGVKVSVYLTQNTESPLETYQVNEESPNMTWSYSDALSNHKAILVSKEHGFIGFSVSGYHFENEQYQFVSAFYLFTIDFESDPIIGAPIIIDHGTTEYQNKIDRSLYINGIFYTFSSNFVVSYNQTTQEIFETISLN